MKDRVGERRAGRTRGGSCPNIHHSVCGPQGSNEPKNYKTRAAELASYKDTSEPSLSLRDLCDESPGAGRGPINRTKPVG